MGHPPPRPPRTLSDVTEILVEGGGANAPGPSYSNLSISDVVGARLGNKTPLRERDPHVGHVGQASKEEHRGYGLWARFFGVESIVDTFSGMLLQALERRESISWAGSIHRIIKAEDRWQNGPISL